MKNQVSVSIFQKIAFAAGQAGWSLAVFGFTELIFFFYLPPDNGTPLFKAFVYQGSVLKIFTIVGLLSAVGYMISAFMEPIVGMISDNASFKFGKRKTLMAFAVLPLAVLSALVFFPLRDGVSAINTYWLIVTVLFAFIIKCFYTTPYSALINEIATDAKERLHIVMMISIAYAAGIGIGQTINIILKVFENQYTNEQIFKVSIIFYALISFILMLMPILFVPDNSGKHLNHEAKQKHHFYDVLKDVWNDKNFRVLVIVELIYWFPTKIFTIAVPYIVTALLCLDNVYTSVVLYATGIGSLLMYPIIDKLVAKHGKKKIMSISILSLVFANLFTASIGFFHISTTVAIAIYVILNAFPTAVLGILPMSMTSDCAQKNMDETGVARNASYFALKTFMMKIGVAITSLIFPSLLLLGKTPSNPLGVRLVAIACIISSLLAYWILRKYKDV